MKIINRQVRRSADVSAARGSAWRELRTLICLAALAIVAIYFAVGLLVDFAVQRISYEREAQLFSRLPVSRVIATIDEDEQLPRVQALLDKLLGNSNVPKIPYRLAIIDEPAPNAFALPGGTIALTRGLLDTVEDDIALAFVLGHELGHFKHRDHLQGLGRSLGMGLAYALLFGTQMQGDGLTPVIFSTMQNAYSRKQESAADEFGITVLYQEFGRTDNFDQLFRFLHEQENTPAWVHIFATHPAPENRIENIKNYMQEHNMLSPQTKPD